MLKSTFYRAGEVGRRGGGRGGEWERERVGEGEREREREREGEREKGRERKRGRERGRVKKEVSESRGWWCVCNGSLGGASSRK